MTDAPKDRTESARRKCTKCGIVDDGEMDWIQPMTIQDGAAQATNDGICGKCAKHIHGSTKSAVISMTRGMGSNEH